MKYRKWAYEEDTIIVEKFAGTFDVDFVIRSDQELVPEVNINQKVILVSDLRDARFDGNDEDVKEMGRNFSVGCSHFHEIHYYLLASEGHEDLLKIKLYRQNIKGRSINGRVAFTVNEIFETITIPEEIRNDISLNLNKPL